MSDEKTTLRTQINETYIIELSDKRELRLVGITAEEAHVIYQALEKLRQEKLYERYDV